MKIDEITQCSTTIKHTKTCIDQALPMKNRDTPMPHTCRVIVVSGTMGSGKSAFVTSAFCSGGVSAIYKNCFEHVHLIMPIETYESELDHPFQFLNKSRVHHELTSTILNDIAQQAIEMKRAGGSSCLIIDDYSELFKTKTIEQALKRLINKSRHYKLMIVMTVLSLKAIPKNLRALIDCYVIFKPKSLLQIEEFSQEVFELPKSQLKSLFDYVFDAPFNFLLYDQRTNSYHKNFNLLKFNEEE